LYGYGGNACPFDFTTNYPPGFHQAVPSLFRLTNARNTRIINLVDYATGGTLQASLPASTQALEMASTGCVHLDRRVLVVSEGDVQLASQLLDRPLILEFD
jgi:hypothetical protein